MEGTERLFFLLIYAIFAYFIARLGDKRNIGFGWSFFFSIILGPVLGVIIVLCSKKKQPEFVEVKPDKE